MSQTTELETLVTRFTGDNAGLLSSIKQTETRLRTSANSIEAEGRRLTDSLKTGQEAYANRVGYLSKLLKAGAISQETYARGVKQAELAMQKWNDAQEEGANLTQISTRRFSILGYQLRAFGSEAAAALVPVLALWHGVKRLGASVALAEEFESQQVKMEVMLKSADKAKKMMEDIEQFAAKTPLGSRELIPVANQLLQSGFEMEKIIPTMRMLGDAVMGDAQALQRVGKQFTDTKKLGRLLGEELNVMAEAGFDAMEALEKSTGKNRAELMKMKEAGQITFQMLNKAIQQATGPQGRYFQGMEKSATTMKGLRSTLADNMSILQRQIGQDIVDLFRLKDVIRGVGDAIAFVTDRYKQLTPETKRFIVGTGAATAALTAFKLLWPILARVGPPLLKVLAGGILALVNPINHVKKAWAALTLLFTTSPIGVAVRLLLGAVTLLGAMFVSQAGGIVGALEQIKGAAERAWAWTEPIRQALVSFFNSVWEVIKAVGERVQQFLSTLWDVVFGQTKADWDKIRNVVVEAILFMEYTVRNFAEVCNLVWLKIKLGFHVMVDGMKDGFIALVAAAWATAASVGTAFKHATDVLTGVMSFDDLGREMGESFNKAFAKAAFTLGAGERDATKQARKDFKAQEELTKQKFADFRDAKLKQFEEERKAQGKHNDKKLADEDKFQSGMASKVSAGDAAALRSAEARTRMYEYRFNNMRRNPDGTPMDPNGAAADKFRGQQAAAADAYRKRFAGYKSPKYMGAGPNDMIARDASGNLTRGNTVVPAGQSADVEKKQLDTLKAIEKLIQMGQRNPAVVLNPAGLGGI